MSGRSDKKITRARRRRGLVYVVGAAAVVVLLLYFEQVELIYVLSVLGLCCFLLVIAFSDLDRGVRQTVAPAREEKEAAAVVGVTAAAAPPVVTRRTAKRRRRAQHEVG